MDFYLNMDFDIELRSLFTGQFIGNVKIKNAKEEGSHLVIEVTCSHLSLFRNVTTYGTSLNLLNAKLLKPLDVLKKLQRRQKREENTYYY